MNERHWNCTPHHKRRACFFVAPKCGNSSVKRAIADDLGWPQDIQVHRNLERWSPGHARGSGYLCIGIVRHPMARAVSCWWQKLAAPVTGKSMLEKRGFWKGMTFLEFAERCGELPDATCGEVHIRGQAYLMMDDQGIVPEHIFDIDHPDCWRQVQHLVPMPPLGRVNASNPAKWQDVACDVSYGILRKRYSLDFEVFGYA